MNIDDLKNIAKEIVKKATIMKDKYTDQNDAPVSYVAIFVKMMRSMKNLQKS